MFNKPFLKLRELNGAWFDKATRGKPAYPVIGDPDSLRYLSVLANHGFNRFPGHLNAFFYLHVLTL